ncbi:hypothetical protein F5Y09DRAFT_317799 [Xylaria sp. FL1042]|nr:hypothetical protein F5Y09DRAFT_317799 [Xylaria sp. FL1042]
MMRPTDVPFIVGNDICRIARVRRILQGRLGPQFVRRILRPEEIDHSTTAKTLRCIFDRTTAHGSEDAQRTVPPEVTGAYSAPEFSRAVEFIAGRFAAKEAVIKAHPSRRLTFQRIAILRAAFRSDPEESTLGEFEQATGQEKGAEGETQERVEEGTREDRASPPQSGPLVAEIEPGFPSRLTYASVSISHDTEYVTAVCVGINPLVISNPGEEDPC